MNQTTLDRDDVLVKCLHLAQNLQLTFSTKHPHMYDSDAAFLPHLVQTLAHAQALPMDLLSALTFVANVYQQLAQSHYVEPSVLQSVLYHMQMPPLNAFVQPTPYPIQYHPHHSHHAHHHHHHPYVPGAPPPALYMPPPQHYYGNSFAPPHQPHYVVASPHHGMVEHSARSPSINQMESSLSPTGAGYACPPQHVSYQPHPTANDDHGKHHHHHPQNLHPEVAEQQPAPFSPRFGDARSSASSPLLHEPFDLPATDAFLDEEAFLCREFADNLLPFDLLSAGHTSTSSLSPRHTEGRPETNYTFSKDISLDIQRHMEQEYLLHDHQSYGLQENGSDDGKDRVDLPNARGMAASPSHGVFLSGAVPSPDKSAHDEDLFDAALELRFQPFLDSLTHDDDDAASSKAATTALGKEKDPQPQDSDSPLDHENPSSLDVLDQQGQDEVPEQQLTQSWLRDERDGVLATASGDAVSVTSSSGSDDADVRAAPLPLKEDKDVQPKRRYLYDAPTPLEIQKQSVQIHMQTDKQQGRAVTTPSSASTTASLPTAEDVVAATTTWISRMHGQGHCFDDKARQKFQELAAVDPYRAVGITVSFDIRKDTIQNKSAWLARACFNCQRKHHPSATPTAIKSTSFRKAMPPKTTNPTKTTTTTTSLPK